MALKATIFKAQLQIADMERNHYGDYSLTIARHPSETDERMMVRLVAFALNAGETLAFTKGLCADEEPDLWQKNLTGEIECWIDVGQPDERRVRKACGRAKQVCIYAYGGRTADIWWEQNKDKLLRFDNLTVASLTTERDALASLVDRHMRLHCTIQEGQIWLGNGGTTVQLAVETRMRGQ